MRGTVSGWCCQSNFGRGVSTLICSGPVASGNAHEPCSVWLVCLAALAVRRQVQPERHMRRPCVPDAARIWPRSRGGVRTWTDLRSGRAHDSLLFFRRPRAPTATRTDYCMKRHL